MKKRLLILISMLAVMFSLSACSDEKDKPFEYDENAMAYNTMALFMQYEGVTESRQDYYLEDGTDFEKSAIKGIAQAKDTDDVGEFEDYTEVLKNYSMNGNIDSKYFDITNNADTVTVTVHNKAENRDVDISVEFEENAQFYIEYDKLMLMNDANSALLYVYQNYGEEAAYQLYNQCNSEADVLDRCIRIMLNDSEEYQYIPKEMVVTAVYSKSELMKKAAVNTLIGMGTVFVVLIFISFIISLFKYLPKIFAKKEKKDEINTPAKETSEVSAVSENLVDDSELVAVITAAIYAASKNSGVSKDKLVVRSIKRARR